MEKTLSVLDPHFNPLKNRNLTLFDRTSIKSRLKIHSVEMKRLKINNDFRDIFYHCIELTYVDFTKFSFSTAIEVSSMFYDNKKLETVISTIDKTTTSKHIEDLN